MQSTQIAPVVQTITDLPGLIENFLLLLSDKEKVVITKRFALVGADKATLEEIGKEFAVTRERVRQIEKNALSKMRRNVFNTALRSLHEYVAIVVKNNGGIIKSENLIGSLAKILPNNVDMNVSNLNLSLALHEGLECVGNTINFYPYVRDRLIPEYHLKHVADQLINLLHKYGDVKKLDKVSDELNPHLKEVNFDVVKVKSLIEIDKRLTLLNDDLVGLLEWRHIHPRTLRDKILFVLRNEKKPMHFAAIAEKIDHANFDKRTVNVQAVHNELIRHDQFVLIGRGIYALAEWGYEKGTVAEVIEKVLREHKELDQDKIVDLVLKQRDVKRITIILALKNDRKFARIGRRVYKMKTAR
ncbi:hypothetical protein HZA40_01685 [Candidatus Peregrinibacteria bacterium]|nr:hypothetical protein [Candidatus Peregrinibacteria bacterium]